MRNGIDSSAPGWALTPSGDLDHAAIEQRARALRRAALRGWLAAVAARAHDVLSTRARSKTAANGRQVRCGEGVGCHT